MKGQDLRSGPDSRLLALNTIITLGGQVFVALAVIGLLPIIVEGLGADGYGLLSLALAIFGAFGLLDLGLGRTTTKFVAEYLNQGEFEKVGNIIFTSLMLQIFLGLIGGALLAILTPMLAEIILKAPYDRISDTKNTLYVLAMSTPVVLASAALRGTLEGAQRFCFVAYVKLFINLSTYVIPVIALHGDVEISRIVFWMLASRLAGVMAYFAGCVHAIPALRQRLSFDKRSLNTLFSYSGWVALSNIAVILLVYFDRFLIASLVTIGAVTYYSAPYELLNGLWIIPGAVSAVLFPAFSGMHRGNHEKLPELFTRPIKYILIMLGPIVLVMMVFSENILTLWLGQSFADESTLVLQLLAFGVVINSLAWTPANLLMGFGRPDVTAKIHLIQLPIYLVIAYPLINYFGIVGAAVAFCLRVIFEALLLFGASMRLIPQTRQIIYDSGIRNAIVCLLLLAFFVFCIGLLKTNLLLNVSLMLLSTAAFMVAVWQYALDRKDKFMITTFIPLFR